MNKLYKKRRHRCLNSIKFRILHNFFGSLSQFRFSISHSSNFIYQKLQGFSKWENIKLASHKRAKKILASKNKNEFSKRCNQAVRKSLNQSKQALQSSFETTAGWVEKTVQKTNQEHFQNVQTQYQAKLGDEITANNMTKNQLKKLLPMSAYPACGFTHSGHTFVQEYFLRKLFGPLTAKGKGGKKGTKKKR